MKNNGKYSFAVFCAMIIVAFTSGTAISGGKVTITGRVNDNYQIVTFDGTIYEVEGNEKGDEIVNLVGKQVKATGTVEQSEGMKIIFITSYEVIGKQSVTIVGTVNDYYQIVTEDGKIYTVEENEKSFKLIDECVGKQVKVTGTVEQSEGMKIITITSYEVSGE